MFYKKSKVFTFGVLALILSIFFSNLHILSFGKGKIFSSVETVSPATVALVFGGGMKDDGVTMSEMQEDRVKRAVQLYKAGKVQKLVMTGDDGGNNADEVGAMKKFAIENGVPATGIEIDPYGYNTFKSCSRAKQVFHLDEVIAISQTFHLSRILYFCSHDGIETTGLSSDLRDYGWRGKIWTGGMREWLARVKAVVSQKSEIIGNTLVN
jgi:SanA protein